MLHTLVAKLDDDVYWRYELLCPAPADEPAGCNSWWPCACNEGKDHDERIDDSYESCPTSPVGDHQYFSFCGELCIPKPGTCFARDHDCLSDAASYLGIKVPGHYLVDDEVEDETDLSLHLIYPEECRTQRYPIVPSSVISRTDGDRHHISGHQLARLYGLQPGEYYIKNSFGGAGYSNLIPLGPRADGDYSLPGR